MSYEPPGETQALEIKEGHGGADAVLIHDLSGTVTILTSTLADKQTHAIKERVETPCAKVT